MEDKNCRKNSFYAIEMGSHPGNRMLQQCWDPKICFLSLRPGSDHSPGYRPGVRSGLPTISPGKWRQDWRSEAWRVQWLLGESRALQWRSGPLLRLSEHPRCKQKACGYVSLQWCWCIADVIKILFSVTRILSFMCQKTLKRHSDECINEIMN